MKVAVRALYTYPALGRPGSPRTIHRTHHAGTSPAIGVRAGMARHSRASPGWLTAAPSGSYAEEVRGSLFLLQTTGGTPAHTAADTESTRQAVERYGLYRLGVGTALYTVLPAHGSPGSTGAGSAPTSCGADGLRRAVSLERIRDSLW